MDVGIALPQYDYSVGGERPLRWETVEAWAAGAERVGFTSLWVSDHLFLGIDKYGGPPGEFGCFSAIPTMGALAHAHPAMTVGCLVFCAPLRPPRLLAKQLQTIDAFAPGHVIAGVGAGWYEPEFAAAGIPFERLSTRRTQLAGALDEMRDFFAGPIGDGRAVPLWAGGKGDRLIETAVAHADGWNTAWAWTAEDYLRKLDVVERACDRAGRDPKTFTRSLGLTTLVGENRADLERRFERLRSVMPAGVLDGTSLDEWRKGRLVGTVEEVRTLVAAWRDLGVAMVVANLGALPFSVTELDDLELVASALT